MRNKRYQPEQRGTLLGQVARGIASARRRPQSARKLHPARLRKALAKENPRLQRLVAERLLSSKFFVRWPKETSEASPLLRFPGLVQSASRDSTYKRPRRSERKWTEGLEYALG